MSKSKAAEYPMPPGPIEGPSAWYGKEMLKTDEWIFRLNDEDNAEIEAAVAATQSLAIKDITRADFKLPNLGPRLVAVLDEIMSGRGFILMRGIRVDYDNIDQAARAYWGLGNYLGTMRSQNARGDLLGHVIDLSRSVDDPTARIYQTNARQNYHADSTDIVSLLCLQRSMSGGASSILSSVTVYNEMLKRDADLTREMFNPFYIDRRGEVPEGKDPWYIMPVFCWHDGLLTTQFTRPYIDSAQRLPGVPRLTDQQIAALDLFQELCEDSDIHLNMDFEPGDMQFLQNYQVLHDRTAFEDWPDAPEEEGGICCGCGCAPSRAGNSRPRTSTVRKASPLAIVAGSTCSGTRLNVNSGARLETFLSKTDANEPRPCRVRVVACATPLWSRCAATRRLP